MATTKSKANIKEPVLSTVAKLALAVIGLVLAYGFGSRAIDSGSLLQYAASLVFFILSIRQLVGALKKQT